MIHWKRFYKGLNTFLIEMFVKKLSTDTRLAAYTFILFHQDLFQSSLSEDESLNV